MTWKIMKSNETKIGRFTIIQDEVQLPNEKEISFSYIDFAKGVCILAITDEGHVLCIKQYRHALKTWQWELPAGAIDPDDPSPLVAAKRELEEETGYKAHTWTDLGSFYPSAGSTSEEIYLFLATDLVHTTQLLEESEQLELHVLEWDKLQELLNRGEFQHGAGMAVILRYVGLKKEK
ncbi:NUDIX hydrolase [Bacillus sp. BGMRC 2118]|nr:NUDIX hydrolase [Bacillus sp. BGMRC 2118]